ncbi:MAG: Re/Si-specific NAD(P)(+) transhydrogenase subunit alpha [Acidobacteriota bacterium]
MRIGVPKEIHEGELRVAATPDVAAQLQALGFEVAVEKGSGAGASLDDAAFLKAGVTILEKAALWSDSDIILKVRAPQSDELDLLHQGQTLIAFLWPGQNPDLLKELSERGLSALSMDSIPRISRAQKMDALSSMANIAGYRAVIEAAQHFGRFFTGQITAAGRIPPARVLVIGAGVAGLAAIGTARSLGAVVRAFDTRPEVREQVGSLNAEFLELDFHETGSGAGGYARTMSPEFIAAEMALFAAQAAEVDIIITTALIPGKPAPKLITAAMVASMKPGSVIVDLAAEQGGNCELTERDRVVTRNGVSIVGYTDLPSRMAAQSSQLYATNLRHLLADLSPEKDGRIHLNMDDEIIRGATVVREGVITWPPPAPKIAPAPAASQPAKQVAPPATKRRKKETRGPDRLRLAMAFAGLFAVLIALGLSAPPSFMPHFLVFVLSCFVGYMVVWNVTPALHTPLMSVTNAISSIIILGALLQVGSSNRSVAVLAAVTITLTCINIFGGFAVTQRMLRMFRK